MSLPLALLSALRSALRTRTDLTLENLALRQQLALLRYYHGSRTHLALAKDTPEPRAVELPEQGRVVALPQVGGLHHRYVRHAA